MHQWKSDNRTGAMKLEAQIAASLGWQHNQEQRGGKTPDMVDPEGRTYEFKNLARKADSRDAYIELETSYDYKKTWKPSGIPVQATYCEYFLFAIPGQRLLKIPATTLIDLIYSRMWAEWTTRPNANGNRDGHFARGVYIPFDTLANTFGVEVLELAPDINPAGTTYAPRALEVVG